MAVSFSDQSEFISSLLVEDDENEEETMVRLRMLNDKRVARGIIVTKLFIKNSNDSNIQLFRLLEKSQDNCIPRRNGDEKSHLYTMVLIVTYHCASQRVDILYRQETIVQDG